MEVYNGRLISYHLTTGAPVRPPGIEPGTSATFTSSDPSAPDHRTPVQRPTLTLSPPHPLPPPILPTSTTLNPSPHFQHHFTPLTPNNPNLEQPSYTNPVPGCTKYSKQADKHKSTPSFTPITPTATI